MAPPPPLLILPFVLLLGAMALGPVLAPAWWQKHYPKVALGLGALTAAVYLFVLPDPASVGRAAHEYVSFIALVGSLYVVTGGIRIQVPGGATPLANVIFLFTGAVAANVLGTTGAAMLLIRPWMAMNRDRLAAYHIAFFIFLIANIGGCLTPIGDPPLFLGYLQGIPFWWVAQHCWPMWATGVGLLLAMFWVVDRIASPMHPGNLQPPTSNAQPPVMARRQGHWMFGVGCWMLDVSHRFRVFLREIFRGDPHEPLGKHSTFDIQRPTSNEPGRRPALRFISGEQVQREQAIFHEPGSAGVAPAGSGTVPVSVFRTGGETPPEPAADNGCAAVAPEPNATSGRWRVEGLPNLLFLAVVVGAVFIQRPPMFREGLMLAAAAGSFYTTKKSIHAANDFNFHPVTEVAVLFAGIFATMIPALAWLDQGAARWLGADPAPGIFYWGAGALSALLDNAPTYLGFLSALFGVAGAGPIAHLLAHHASHVVAVSVGTVFFGAATYLGNGPNFMVKGIASQHGVPMPSFGGFILKFSLPFLLPALVAIALLFFRD